MAEKLAPPDRGARSEIAKSIVKFSVAGVAALSIVALAVAANSSQAALLQTTQMVFASVLPLLGTWVGTVLAFYFSRENFEAANKSVQDLVK